MSATGLDVFDKTLQTTHTWLNEVMEVVGPDRHVAWHVLGAVLRTLRDRIPIELAAHLGSELPILVRGLYYDQWRPAAKPETFRNADEFLSRVGEKMLSTRPVDVREATRAVLQVLSRHVAQGQTSKVRHALPEDIRLLWPEPVGGELDVPTFAEDAGHLPGRDV